MENLQDFLSQNPLWAFLAFAMFVITVTVFDGLSNKFKRSAQRLNVSITEFVVGQTVSVPDKPRRRNRRTKKARLVGFDGNWVILASANPFARTFRRSPAELAAA